MVTSSTDGSPETVWLACTKEQAADAQRYKEQAGQIDAILEQMRKDFASKTDHAVDEILALSRAERKITKVIRESKNSYSISEVIRDADGNIT